MMKILVIGEARHGKDSFAEFVSEFSGAKFTSSSYFAMREIIYPVLQPLYNYNSLDDCYADRVNHREVWYTLIRDYNTPCETALATELMKENDMYVGMRSADELKACKQAKLFDTIVWVDASKRLDSRESTASCTVTSDMADIVIENNGSLGSLRDAAARFVCDIETLIEDRHVAEAKQEFYEATDQHWRNSFKEPLSELVV
jgi:hypothetical protein